MSGSTKDHELNACVKHLIFDIRYLLDKKNLIHSMFTSLTRSLVRSKNKLIFDVNKNAQKEREEKKKIQ